MKIFLNYIKTCRNSFSIIENVLWLYADRIIRMGLGFFLFLPGLPVIWEAKILVYIVLL